MPEDNFSTNVAREVVREFTWPECFQLIPKWQHLVGNVRELVDDAGRAAGQMWLRDKKAGTYVGRKMPGRFPTGSRFGNPFPLSPRWTQADREECAARYLLHALSKSAIRNELPRLRGEKLWCWCAPELCHAHVLAVLANELPGPDPEFVKSGLARLELHLLAGNFEMLRQTADDLERTYAENNLPHPELTRKQREALTLGEIGLEELVRNIFEKVGVMNAGQLALFVLSGRQMPSQLGNKRIELVRQKLASFGLLPEMMRRGMLVDKFDRTLLPMPVETEE